MAGKVITVRDFTPADQIAARAIIQSGLRERWGDRYDADANPDTDDLYASYIDPGPDDSGPTGDERMSNRFANSEVVVATVSGRGGGDDVGGIAILVPEADGLGRIVRMSVARTHRRRGIARALIAELVARARSKGHHAVIVSTDTPWSDAVALYEDSGFVVTEADDADIDLWLDLVWTDEEVVTDRTVLKAPTAADNMFVVEMLIDESVRTFLGGPASFAIVEWIKAHSLAPQWGTFVVHLPESDLPGERQRIGLVALEDWRGELELSLQLLPEFWGQGFAHELSRAVLDWAWAHTDAPSIIAVTHADNARAVAAMERLGFVADRRFDEFGEPHIQGRLARPL